MADIISLNFQRQRSLPVVNGYTPLLDTYRAALSIGNRWLIVIIKSATDQLSSLIAAPENFSAPRAQYDELIY